MSGRTLYADSARERFFHVPDDAALPAGELVLSSLTGKTLSTTADAAAPYEVDEAEAQRIVAQRLEAFGDGMRQIMGSAAAALAGLKPDAPPGPRSAFRDPATVGPALEGVLKDILGAVRDLEVDPASVDARMKSMADAVRAKDPQAAQDLEAIPDALRELIADPKVLGAMEEAAADLRSAAADLRAQTAALRAARAGRGES
ncbi:MAG: hypothetical protein RLZZ299_858 [Pseudomonadota bacterium]|jgi:hypothetical protein